MKSWISIILAVIFLSAIVIFNIKQPNPLPVSNLSPTPTATLTPTPTLSPSSCLPNSLQATLSFQGAAGSIYGTARLTNISSRPCTLTHNKQLQLTYLPTIKNITVIHSGIIANQLFNLNPKSSLYAQIRMPNGPQCQSPIHQVQASLNYEVVPGQLVTFTNNGKPDFLINACQGKEMTEVDIATFSAKPLP